MKKVSVWLAVVSCFLFTGVYAGQIQRFPTAPHPVLTPGALCSQNDQTNSQTRYPEKILYCVRSVSSEQKQKIMQTYDARLGYQTTTMDRSSFKIDHLIPLCMGGANVDLNLWPQHKSIYDVTDPVEPALCAQMAQGQIKQNEAINLIKRAKADLNFARQLAAELGVTFTFAPLF